MATKKATTTAKSTTKKTAAPKAAATKAAKPAVKKAAAPKKPAETSAAKKIVSKVKDIEEKIRKKAEEIYHARIKAGKPGTAESDWHEAEKAVKGGKKK
jgi:hypothetical protein